MNDLVKEVSVIVAGGLILAFILGLLEMARKQPVQFGMVFGLLVKLCFVWMLISGSLVATSRLIAARLRSGEITLEALERVSLTRDLLIVFVPLLALVIVAGWSAMWEWLHSAEDEKEQPVQKPSERKPKPPRGEP